MDWLKDFDNKTESFLRLMGNRDFTYFKYSLSGDLYKESDKWGLANLVFAAKVLYSTGLLEKLDPGLKDNLVKSILSFTQKDGYISDPLITELNFKSKINKLLGRLHPSISERIENVRRAETRQSIVALSILDAKPEKPFTEIPYSIEEAEKYVNSFDWSHPWHAASHLSHLFFFLNFNARLFGYRVEDAGAITKYLFDWLCSIQSEADGTWYTGQDVGLSERINGALKVLTGLYAAGIKEFPNYRSLVDTALSGINDDEACGNFNIAYVLCTCSRIDSNYRRDEIEEFLRKRVDIYKRFYHSSSGGFSFHENRANDVYFGKQISEGRNEADIHGTNMFVLGLSEIAQIIDLGREFRVMVN